MDNKVIFLKQKANELRKNILTMIYTAKSGHPGGSLSLAEILSVLYYDEINIDPKNPQWVERDRVILSKGHCCPAIYSILAMKGYFDMEVLGTLRQIGSILQGHPYMIKVPGIDMTTGSLGQGLSAAVGMAIGAKANGFKSRVFVILGDGETNEGQVWEAVMSASKYKLDNLIAIIDKNSLQNDDFTCKIMPMEPMEDKWVAFGWHVIKTDGHDVEKLLETFKQVKNVKGKPVCIIAETVKGKGISFMENVCSWHGTPPDDEQYRSAMEELRRNDV